MCGRQLTLATGDDRLDAGTNRSETERLSREVFAFVGGTSPVDDGGASVLGATNIDFPESWRAPGRVVLGRDRVRWIARRPAGPHPTRPT